MPYKKLSLPLLFLDSAGPVTLLSWLKISRSRGTLAQVGARLATVLQSTMILLTLHRCRSRRFAESEQ